MNKFLNESLKCPFGIKYVTKQINNAPIKVAVSGDSHANGGGEVDDAVLFKLIVGDRIKIKALA